MAWDLKGNSGTQPSANWLGTNDHEPLVIKSGGKEALRVDPQGYLGVGTQNPAAPVEVVGNWNGSEGALRLTGDKPTLKFAAGAIAGNQTWILHVGSDGPGNFEIFKQGASPTTWDNVMTFTPGGAVGIGTRNPTARANGKLVVEVQGGAGVAAVVGVNDVADVATAGNGGWFESAESEGVRGWSKNQNHGGVVGINTAGGVGVYGQSVGGVGVWGTSDRHEGVHAETSSPVTAAVAGYQLNQGGTGAGVYAESRGQGPAGFFKGNAATGIFSRSEAVEGVHAETNSGTTAAVAAYQMNPAGTGAGVYAESRGQGPAGFFKGNVVVTGDIFVPGADCAEHFDVAEGQGGEAGSVMVIDDQGELAPCGRAYDKKVAGVISGAGSFRPGIILDQRQARSHRLPISLIGKVYCKVDADIAPIEVGDLLTTSPTQGHAMKAAEPGKAFGAVIGKALAPLARNRGLVPILVCLQ